MATFNERLIASQDFITTPAADITTAGTIQDLANTNFSFARLTLCTTLESVVAASAGKQLQFVNANSVAMVVKNLTGGTAANQIITGAGADVSVPAGATLSLKYDGTAAKWRVTGGASGVTGPSSSVDSEIALFNGTSGSVIKRATGTGYAKVTSGVLQTPSATVPAADVFGSVTGSAVASGFIGETQASSLGNVSLTSGVEHNAGTLTLPAGVWAIYFKCGIGVGGSPSTFTLGECSISTTSASRHSPSNVRDLSPEIGNDRYIGTATRYANISTSTVFYGVVSVSFSGGTYTATGSLSQLYAIRVG